MSIEEFLRLLEEYTNTTKLARENYLAFSTKLTKELTDIVFTHLPSMENQPEVNELVGRHVKEVNKWFGWVNLSFYNKEPVTEIRVVPKPKTREDAEKQLVEELKKIPKEEHELFTKYHWEDFEDNKRHEDFLFATFDKMKGVLVEVYFESIVDFDSDYLRKLDYTMYRMCAERFVEEVYELELSELPGL